MLDLILVPLFIIKNGNFTRELQETADTQNSMLSVCSTEKPIRALSSMEGYLVASTVRYTVCARMLEWGVLSGSRSGSGV